MLVVLTVAGCQPQQSPFQTLFLTTLLLFEVHSQDCDTAPVLTTAHPLPPAPPPGVVYTGI